MTTVDEAAAALDAVERFNDAFNSRDVDAVVATMTHDCVFESTAPPDGERHEGADAVRAAWAAFFASTPSPRFEVEEAFAAADRAVVRWCFRWGDGDDHVRGVDVFQVRDGKIAVKLSYVKG